MGSAIVSLNLTQVFVAKHDAHGFATGALVECAHS